MSFVVMSRQGLRRFKALQPALRFHDSFHPTDARFSKVVFGHSQSKSSRKIDRVPVCPGFVDAEYVSISDLVEATTNFPAEPSPAFLEQLGARLRKDADIICVHDLVSILSVYVASDYLDLSVLHKFAKELRFDASKLSLGEVGIVLHAFAHFRVSDSKMQRKLVEHANTLPVKSASDLSGVLLAIVHQNDSSPLLVAKIDAQFFNQVDLSLLISVFDRLKGPPALKEFFHSVDLPDIKSSADLVHFGIQRPDLVEKLSLLAPDVLNVQKPDILSCEYIARRNEAGQICAKIFLAATRLKNQQLIDAYSPLLNNQELIKGLRTHQLVRLEGQTASREVSRKFNSLSAKQRKMIRL